MFPGALRARVGQDGRDWLAEAWVGVLQATRLLRLDRLELMETAI